MIKGSAAAQRDPARLEEWLQDKNSIKFNQDKHSILHVRGTGTPAPGQAEVWLAGKQSCWKNLGVLGGNRYTTAAVPKICRTLSAGSQWAKGLSLFSQCSPGCASVLLSVMASLIQERNPQDVFRKRQPRWEGAGAGVPNLRVGLVQPGGPKSSTQYPRHHQGEGVRLLMEVQS